MNEIKIVVVDDSPFSVTMISNILEENGFSVVGSANSMAEAVEVVAKIKPDVVTMDMTMPGGDGLECTKALHILDPDLKVVIVSSMMDEEIIHKAKKAKVSGYVQKPLDGEEISLLIHRIMADEHLFVELEEMYFQAFKEAFTDTCNKFFKSVPVYLEENTEDAEQTSRGISVVLGIIGKYGGRMILDMSAETAKKTAEILLAKEILKTEEIINVIGEISNIIAGNACSMINKKNNLYGLRVAPPTVVYGEAITISKGELNTVSSVLADTVCGQVCINVGFNRSEQNE